MRWENLRVFCPSWELEKQAQFWLPNNPRATTPNMGSSVQFPSASAGTAPSGEPQAGESFPSATHMWHKITLDHNLKAGYEERSLWVRGVPVEGYSFLWWVDPDSWKGKGVASNMLTLLVLLSPPHHVCSCSLPCGTQLTMNDFSVHRIIGRGGFGEVYGCRKADTGKM